MNGNAVHPGKKNTGGDFLIFTKPFSCCSALVHAVFIPYSRVDRAVSREGKAFSLTR
jgi:hypothetical protein